ncbi:MAG: hypothetical protein WAM11_06595 [Cyanobium sp.]
MGPFRSSTLRATETAPANRSLGQLPGQLGANVFELLRPGSFVRLRNQPDDLPPFQLIQCRGGRCWVRQQSWGHLVQWEVAHRQLTTVG